jgi:hypothetical protein
MSSKSFSSQNPRIPHLLLGGGMGKEVRDVRSDVDTALEALESRDATLEYPELDWLDGAITAAGADIVLKERNLLQGQEFATLTLFTGTSELIFRALTPGAAGNDLTIEIQDTGSLTVTKTDDAVVITINLGTTTADEIATLVNTADEDTDGYLTCNGGGAGVAQAVTAATNMAGGTGSGFVCRVGGLVALPANTQTADGADAITDTQATMTSPAVGAASDVVQITVCSNNVYTQPLSGVLS